MQKRWNRQDLGEVTNGRKILVSKHEEIKPLKSVIWLILKKRDVRSWVCVDCGLGSSVSRYCRWWDFVNVDMKLFLKAFADFLLDWATVDFWRRTLEFVIKPFILILGFRGYRQKQLCVVNQYGAIACIVSPLTMWNTGNDVRRSIRNEEVDTSKTKWVRN
jgi:hypothetical protein